MTAVDTLPAPDIELPDGYAWHTLTYLGEFPGQGAKVVAVWREPDGTRTAWISNANTRATVGAIYHVAVNADGTHGQFGSKVWTGLSADDVQDLQLDARNRREDRDRAAAEKRAAKDGEIQRLLDDAARIGARLTTWGARDQLVEELRRAITRASFGKGSR